MQIFGGRGYIRENVAQRFYRELAERGARMLSG
jgi:alkylation response protein AidB-like acyl-CoA dehydrogenase